MRIVDSRFSPARKTRATGAAPDRSLSPAGDVSVLPSPPTISEARIGKILRRVESGKNLTIRDLALEFHVSRSHLQRLFKHETGVSMGEWLSGQRLQRAAHLLATTYMSVKEIAHAVGYEHVSSFIRAFERRFAQPPARYRKQIDCTKC